MGTVVRIQSLAAKPLTVQYDSGETRSYADASAMKLDIVGGSYRGIIGSFVHNLFISGGRRHRLKRKSVGGASSVANSCGVNADDSSSPYCTDYTGTDAHMILSAFVARVINGEKSPSELVHVLGSLATALRSLNAVVATTTECSVQRSKLTALIGSLDVDCDGRVTRSGLIATLLAADVCMDELELSAAMHIFDADGDGLIDGAEFTTAIRNYADVVKLITVADALGFSGSKARSASCMPSTSSAAQSRCVPGLFPGSARSESLQGTSFQSIAPGTAISDRIRRADGLVCTADASMVSAQLMAYSSADSDSSSGVGAVLHRAAADPGSILSPYDPFSCAQRDSECDDGGAVMASMLHGSSPALRPASSRSSPLPLVDDRDDWHDDQLRIHGMQTPDSLSSLPLHEESDGGSIQSLAQAQTQLSLADHMAQKQVSMLTNLSGGFENLFGSLCRMIIGVGLLSFRGRSSACNISP